MTTEPTSTPQEAGAPPISDDELTKRLNDWIAQYREFRDTSLNRYRIETLQAVLAALASREAEVRRLTEEVELKTTQLTEALNEVEDMQGRLESFQNGYGSMLGSRERVQAVLAEVLGAERKCRSTADDVRLALDTRAAEVRRQVAEDIEASAKVAPEDRYAGCTCAAGQECYPHACHRAMNEVTKDSDGMWPVQIAGGVWDALEPLIRADAARTARGES